jgi:two-component system response regulator YesN
MDLLLERGGGEAQRQTISELRNNGYLEAAAFSVWLCSQPGLSPTLDTIEMEQIAGTVLGRQVLVHSGGQGIQAAYVLLIALQQDELSLQTQLAEKLLQALDLLPGSGDDLGQERVAPAGWIIGTGSPRENIGFISESFRETQSVFNFAVFNGLSGVVAADVEQLARKQFTKDSERFTHQFRELAKRLRYDLGSGGSTGPVMDELFSLLGAHPGAGRSYIATLLGGVLESCSSLALPAAQAATAVATNHMEALLACSRLLEMGAYTAGVIDEMAGLLEEKRNRKDDYLINRVIVLIEQQYGNQELSLAYLAGEVFVSPNHLGMIFKKKTGKTPSEYIQEFRLARAEEMLRTTKQRIAVVAEQIGIPNASYFGLLYKQVYGMTPGEYREFVQR